jgi:hypothetical protein
MKDSTNKIKIVKTLLESPKTTGQIAIALGYKDEKGYGKYKNIISDLKTLEQYKFIYRTKPNKKSVGAPATTYDIRYELPILRGILETYPSLVSDLQKNYHVFRLLELPLKPPSHYSKDYELWAINMYAEGFNDICGYILWMIQHSQTFFKNLLLLQESYFKVFFEIWKGENGHLDYFKSINYDSMPSRVCEDILYDMFFHAVATDKLNGVLDSEALGFMRGNPMPLRWEKLLSHAHHSALKKSELEKKLKKKVNRKK